MIRTQISLGEGEYERVKREARRLGLSFAEILRRALRAAIPPQSNRPWMKFAGLIASGDPHSSQRIDELVYGQKD